MATLRTHANFLARYIGVYDLAPDPDQNTNNSRGVTANDRNDLLTCLQAAAQEIYTDAPAAAIKRREGGQLLPPANVTLSVTQYSKVCSITSYLATMAGCTIRISGDDLDNVIISATELLRPHQGSTGSTSATVYCDCITIPTKYDMVIEPVEFPNRACLPMVNGTEEMRYWNSDRVWTPRLRYPNDIWYNLKNKTIQEPAVCMAEYEALGTAAPALYLRFNPMPGQAYAIAYTGRLAPPVIALADFYNAASPTVDPGVSLYLPMGEAVFLAVALKRWTAHPSFSPEGQQLAEIERQYQAAKTLMKKRMPQTARHQVVYSE